MKNQEINKDGEENKFITFDVDISGVVTTKNLIHDIDIKNVNISGDLTLGHFIILMKMFYEQSLKWGYDSASEKAKKDMREYEDILQEMYSMKMEDFVKDYLNKNNGNDKGE